MKKTIIAMLALAGFTSAATLEEMASMEDWLKQDGITKGGADVSSSYVAGNTVYKFTEYATDENGNVVTTKGSEGIYGITDTDLKDYINAGEGYLTIAAWINPTSTTENSIFSFGGHNDGLKFGLKEGKMQMTTKGKKDYPNTLLGVSAGEWTLVALTIALDGSEYRTHVGTASKGYETKTTSGDTGDYPAIAWKTPNSFTFGIGTGNSDGVRDGFLGEIANLAVFKSDDFVDNTAIVTAIGSAPVAIPEPTTATLSLLALAGLAARRRRK